MGKVFVIANRKGGCGKSVTSASIGIALARQGKKVLCIDTDNQFSLTISLGIENPDTLPVTLKTIITDIIAENDIDPSQGIIHHSEGIDLLPANDSLTGIELALAPLIGRETILKQYIEKVKPLYDYCIIDTGPTINLLTVNALAAADNVIIPVAPRFLDAKGLELLLKSISQIQRHINPSLNIFGILLTMVDKRTKLAKEVIGMIEQAYGKNIPIFNDHIPHSIRAAESSAKGMSIFKHDPKGKVAAAYEALTRELLHRGVRL